MDKHWALGYGESMLMDWGSNDGRWDLQYAVGLRNPPAVNLVGAGLGSELGSVAFSAGVVALQKELRALAFTYQDSGLDPAKYDGTMTLGTIIALVNAVERIGADIPGVSTAVNIVKKITGAIEDIPYAGQVIALLLSPWLVEPVYKGILAIIRVIPGGGSVASGIDTAVNSAKTTLAAGAAGIALALTIAPKKIPPPPTDPTQGLGGVVRTRVPLVFYDQRIHGGQVLRGPVLLQGELGTDYRTGAASIFEQGPLRYNNFTNLILNTKDRALYESVIAKASSGDKVKLRKGTKAYLDKKQVPGANKYYSAWYNDDQKKIKVTSFSKCSKYDVVCKGKKAINDIVEDVEDVAEDLYEGVKDLYQEVEKIAQKLREYSCLLVNNDIVVAVVAGGTGIVASPAASAAVVAGAAAGKAACAAIDLAEALYTILKLLAQDFDPPPPLTSATPPAITATAVMMAKLPVGLLKATGGPVRMAKTLTKQPVPISGRLVLPMPAVIKLPKSAYPAGTVVRFHLQKQVWYVYLPKVLKGLEGLGETPPPPDQVLQQKPAGVPEGPPIDDPFYKRPLFWVVVAGLAVAASGTVVVLRKRRRQPLLGAHKPTPSSLHERVAAVLHWSEREVHSVPLAALRDLVRPVDPRLADELSEVLRRGTHLKRP
jgi:hypothetical protein